jgi:hypothetical protein
MTNVNLPAPDQLLTVPLLAHRLGRSPATIRHALASGRIKADFMTHTTEGRPPMPCFLGSRIPQLAAEIVVRN